MKNNLFLMAAGLALMLSVGLALREYSPFGKNLESLSSSIQDLKDRFQTSEKPLRELQLDSLLVTRQSAELRDAETALPALSLPAPELNAVVAYADSCDSKLKPKSVTGESLRKALLWHRFLCKDIASLPKDFFLRKPFMHPNGKSYAWLFKSLGFVDKTWMTEHFSAFHVLELLNDPTLADLSLGVSPGDIDRLRDGESLLVTKNYVLMPLQKRNVNSAEQLSASRYRIYSKKAWDRFIAKERWVPTQDISSANCLLKEESLCWTANLNWKKELRHWMTLTLSLIAFSLAAALFVLWWKRRRFERVQLEQRQFVLQVLTHELRTPATGLTLGLETFRRDFDLLPESSQKAFLLLSGEVHRLHRVIEASQEYLKAEAPIATESLTPVSLNEFVAGLCDDYKEVRFEPSPVPVEAMVSKRWLELCVKNLIDNGLRHGKAPVTVALTEDRDHCRIEVRDFGIPKFDNLAQMTLPFVKGPNSQGLGLGLSVLVKVLARMNAHLEFETDPTTFKICLEKTS